MAGRIRDEDLEEVRRRASLIDIAAEYMQLKRAGRLYKALCPFHPEKTPSMSLDPAKGLYHCFGCGEGGDVIHLVRKIDNLSFVEAVEHLARRTGVDLRYEQLSAADREAQKRRLRLIDAHRIAIEFFHATLMKGPDSEGARAYLKGRGFARETVETFGVGFSLPRREELSRHLARKGFSEDEIVAAGLGMKADGGGLVDRFRGRLMFPIFDVTGNPVAFGARRLGEGDGPKYLNSAESPIYKKAQILYALNVGKSEIVKQGRALVVEGYTDVIALHQAGIREAVATCGTALGLEHLRTLQRFSQQVVLSLDADDAGANAAERMYDQLVGDAQQMGLTVKVVLMAAGQDPADAVRAQGGDAFRALVDDAVPLLEFVLRREADRYAVGDPEVRARALSSGLRLLAKTDNEVVRTEYARRLSDWIKVDPHIIFVELEKVVRTGVVPRATSDAVLKRSSAQVRLEREALKIAIQHPPLVKDRIDDLSDEHLSVPVHRAIWKSIVAGDAPESLPDDDARRAYTELAVQPPAGEVTERLIVEIFLRLKESALQRQIDEMKAALQRINPIDRHEEYEAKFTELIDLERVKRSLSAAEGEER
ncbi:MAG: DNA primase [Actinomycetota bacterium]